MPEDQKKYEAYRLEAQKRFDALPENLKKEMLADKNAKLVFDICKDYGLSEETTKHVALLAGEVFLGYIKPEEIASELHTYFQIDQQKANFIEIELKQKLFSPLKTDLDRIYNDYLVKSIIEEENAEETEEKTAPAIIKTEKETAPMTNEQPTAGNRQSQQKIPPMGTGTAAAANPQPKTLSSVTVPSPKQPSILETLVATPETAAEQTSQETPFIIQRKPETIKSTAPQFPKGTPLLNLKIEPSLVQKTPVKPIPVRLETEQPSSIKFTMPISQQPKTEIPPKPAILPIAPKPAAPQTVPQSEKPKSILQPAAEEARTVHYSNFKTPLTPSGMPKKIEPKKEDYINLATFTKVSGNVVDLRKSTK